MDIVSDAIEGLKRLVLGSTLQKYGTDMTKMAEMGKLEPVIGREREMEQLTQALLKRRKSNACLVGEAGVGKTAIVEGLALNIVRGSVPDKLIGKRIFSIDLTRLVGGTRFRGMFEQRMKDLLDEVRRSQGSVILFVDELHTLVKNGTTNTDIANIIKPALARGDFMCIGATTLEEYTRHIEKDAALKRRFVSIHVGEPSREESIKMLKGIIHKYQTHHRVKYTQTALTSAVDLSKLYIRELFLPDKAIDLIDKAGARAHTLGQSHVSEAEIEHVVSTYTGIPLTKVSTKTSQSQSLLEFEHTLKRSLIGQDEAAAAVARAIRRARAGLKHETKPIGSFLFTRPTGVGKTEMAKLLANEYFGDREAMLRLDMSEYAERYTVSRLIGSSPGYKGYDDGGHLTEAVRRRPHTLVLFDEIEKAHKKVLNLLLQILDDGRLSDGKGKTVDFSNTIVILTSNLGTGNNLRGALTPELLNRFDQVVVFNPLDKEHIRKILEILIQEFCARLAAKKKVQVAFTTELKERLVLEGFDPSYGARPLKRAITSLVEDKLAEAILNGIVAERDTITMDVALDGEIVIKHVKLGFVFAYDYNLKDFHPSIPLDLTQLVNML